ncbi:MAG TPA: ABC transporter permease [Candidatus Limnocylindrales bacterium]|nr:ABC transporter permease [Candidatus Limnocylindrales bacterium]
MTKLRFLYTSWLVHLRQISTMKVYVFDSVVLPLIFATIVARLAARSGSPATITTATLGTAVMGMWVTTLSGTGGSISRLRVMGLLEPIVAAPTPLSWAYAGNALASSTLGIYSVVATLLWSVFGLGLDLRIGSPAALALAVIVMVFATAALGVVLSVSLVMSARAQSMSNLLEYPMWILLGAVVPLSFLPRWAEPLSWLLAPSWGMRAIQAAVAGDVARSMAMVSICVLVTAAYWAIGAMLLRWVERLAREKAVLALS